MYFSFTSLLIHVFLHCLTAYQVHTSHQPSSVTPVTTATTQFANLNTIPSASAIPRRPTPFIHSSHCHSRSLPCLILLCGDVESNPGPATTQFIMCTLNIQSLTDAKSLHSTAIADLAEQHDLDLIALSETWIKPDTSPSHLAECTPPGYSLISQHRPLPPDYNPKHNLGGGLAFLVKDSLNHVLTPCSSFSSFESLAITIKLGHRTLTVFNIYKPPAESKHTKAFATFMDQFQTFLESAAATPHDFIITGDFNIHVNNIDRQSTQFLDLLQAHNLNQLVSFPTHKHGNTLDLVITHCDSSLSPAVSPHPVRPADHHPVLTTLNMPRPTPPATIIRTFRRIQSINVDLFITDLSAETLVTKPPTSLPDLIELYNSTLTRLLNKHAPLVTKTLPQRPRSPWFTPYLRTLKSARRRIEKAWKRSQDSYHTMRLNLITNLYHHSIIKAKKLYNTSLISAAKSQPRRLWQTIDTILHRKPPKVLPSVTPTISLADKFASFFTEKITKLHSSLTSVAALSSPHTAPPTKPHKLGSFHRATPDEVNKLIMQAPNKQCSLDPIPMSLLKHCSHILTPVITNIINLSITTGVFPTHFKQAIITPLLKKPSLDREEFSNYRPISNLSFLSKLTERVVKDRLHKHMSSNSMYNAFQSAYTKFHSTETTLLSIHDHLTKAMDRQQVTGLTLLDLSAAFDTIDHSILLHRLSSWFGICDQALAWFTSYLTTRSFAVSCADHASSPSPLSCGVPQGSVLGPILFIMYTTPLSSLISQMSACREQSQVDHH